MTKEALKLALEALSVLKPDNWVDKELQGRAWDAVKKALAQEQEPVAYQDTAKPDELVAAEDWENIDPMYQSFYRPLYTTPPQRTWVGLSEDDKVLINHDANFNQFMTAGEYADRVQALTEARLKDKNT